MKNRLFICVWLYPSYGDANTSEFKTIEFFSQKMGYSLIQIDWIKNLEVGGTLSLDFNNHFITRVK